MYRMRTYTLEGLFITEEYRTEAELLETIPNLHVTRVVETHEGVLMETSVFLRFFRKVTHYNDEGEARVE